MESKFPLQVLLCRAIYPKSTALLMVIDMIRDGLIPVDKLHTHSLDAADLPRRVPELLKTPDDLLKAIVTI
ncbi:MAG TPA: hypothetical protein VL130_14390 [Asticcacaulis sp.]|nr:hypothetical protein [Asticcacaulis sp.]